MAVPQTFEGFQQLWQPFRDSGIETEDGEDAQLLRIAITRTATQCTEVVEPATREPRDNNRRRCEEREGPGREGTDREHPDGPVTQRPPSNPPAAPDVFAMEDDKEGNWPEPRHACHRQ